MKRKFMAKTDQVVPHEEASLSNQMRQFLASLRLEGIELSPESMADIKLFDAGQISKEELLKRAIERAK